MKDQNQLRAQILKCILLTSGTQLHQCERQSEDLASIMPLAKTPQQRTSMNIILDDQKKVVKALKRLQGDLLAILEVS